LTENQRVPSSILGSGTTKMLSNFHISQFISQDYIFEKTPPFTSVFLYLVGVFVLFMAIAFLGWFYFGKKSRKLPFYRPIQSQVFNLFFYVSLFGLILSFFRWQQLAYLGSRFFLLILLLVFIFWGLSIVYYRFKIFPKEFTKYQAKKNFEKYLPR
jgi:hypothetical protein